MATEVCFRSLMPMLSVTDFIPENLEGKSGKISCDTTPCDVTVKDKNTMERLSFGLMSVREPSNQEDGPRHLATQEDTQSYQCHHDGTEILPGYPSKFFQRQNLGQSACIRGYIIKCLAKDQAKEHTHIYHTFVRGI